ncbi:cytochrome c biogenesis protein ResB [Actinomadura scrupuli]|uniref:cytochrome c biogenesis protein ResB n=1 Tax=Actinomadura scrupuli TaxID=559629 RepID=UPI003D977829
MRTALILLFLVALGSIPGGLLPQRGQAPEQVAAYIADHGSLGSWMDRFSLFDVFAAPWFAAIYILLFVSLAGCVIPRILKHGQNVRARPPAAPRNLGRLPQSASYRTDATPEEALGGARDLLKGRRFRVDAHEGSVAAEKGHLGETGNLIFHLALLVLLFSVGSGAAFGYKGNVLVTEGGAFSNTLTNYDAFKPGREFSADELAPFTISLDEFHASYITSGKNIGQPTSFYAKVRYKDGSGPEKPYDLRVNHPLGVGGTKVYLLGHGYAPTFTVKDGKGQIAFQGSVPFLPMEERTFTSEGVIKAPDAQPTQLGFYGIFFPSAAPDQAGKTISAFPAPLNPRVSIVPFKGDLGLDTGVPQSVYKLEGLGKTLFPVGKAQGLQVGQTLTLPDGAGSITFTGYQQWVSLALNHDPGRVPALAAAVIAIFGIVTSFLIRRRRVWVRASAADGGRTVVEVGGLALGNATAEFDDIVADLRQRVPAVEEPAGESSGDEASGPETPAGESPGSASGAGSNSGAGTPGDQNEE